MMPHEHCTSSPGVAMSDEYMREWDNTHRDWSDFSVSESPTAVCTTNSRAVSRAGD